LSVSAATRRSSSNSPSSGAGIRSAVRTVAGRDAGRRRHRTRDWTGTTHLSALEASFREEVVWAVTLTEAIGCVTTFLDGTYRDYPRDQIGGRWRPEERPRDIALRRDVIRSPPADRLRS
jgi:hypothetical protein